jgi:hypothetical protein
MKPKVAPDFPNCSRCGKPTRRNAAIGSRLVPLCGSCAKGEGL